MQNIQFATLVALFKSIYNKHKKIQLILVNA